MFAARALGRPVKWTSERSEAFLTDTHGRANLTHAELALDKDNNFLALRTHNIADMGAYLSTYAPMIPTMAGPKVLSSVRSEERREGKECVSTCRSWWSPNH